MNANELRFFWGGFFWLLLGAVGFAEVKLEVAEKRISISHQGKVVAVYRGDGRVPCIYPLVGPTGTNVTRHFPLKKGVAGEATDHPHHVSFWMAHGKVNGEDFWHGKGTRIKHCKVLAHERSPDGREVFFTVELVWMAGKKEILFEERSYLFDFSRGDQTLVKVTSVLRTGKEEVVFGDTKEGMFAIRVAPTLRLKGEVAQGGILDSAGRTDGECWGKRSKWVAYHGPDAEGEGVVIALMDHRENLRHPTWWHARDYGLLAANPFGQHDFESRVKEPELGEFVLEKGKSMTLRYQLVLQAGEINGGALREIWNAWK